MPRKGFVALLELLPFISKTWCSKEIVQNALEFSSWALILSKNQNLFQLTVWPTVLHALDCSSPSFPKTANTFFSRWRKICALNWPIATEKCGTGHYIFTVFFPTGHNVLRHFLNHLLDERPRTHRWKLSVSSTCVSAAQPSGHLQQFCLQLSHFYVYISRQGCSCGSKYNQVRGILTVVFH